MYYQFTEKDFFSANCIAENTEFHMYNKITPSNIFSIIISECIKQPESILIIKWLDFNIITVIKKTVVTAVVIMENIEI